MEMELYKTSDIYLAAYLKSKGNKIVKLERPGNKCFFCFEGNELMENNKLLFFNNGYIKVTDYKNAIGDLKTMIHNT